jgi:hypothetical protein
MVSATLESARFTSAPSEYERILEIDEMDICAY